MTAAAEPVPTWLREAASTLHLWRSPSRLVELARQWRATRTDACRPAYELLDAWEQRDAHLDDYEDGTRARSLRWRRETYRVLAAQWARRYDTVLLPDRDLSREARWGEDSEQRFLASPQELRDCLRQAFGDGAEDVPWRGPHGVIDDDDEDADVPLWLEMAIERWCDAQNTGGARSTKKETKIKKVQGGAWGNVKRRLRNATRRRGPLAKRLVTMRNDMGPRGPLEMAAQGLGRCDSSPSVSPLQASLLEMAAQGLGRCDSRACASSLARPTSKWLRRALDAATIRRCRGSKGQGLGSKWLRRALDAATDPNSASSGPRGRSKWLRRALDAATSRTSTTRSTYRRSKWLRRALDAATREHARSGWSRRGPSKWLRRALDAATRSPRRHAPCAAPRNGCAGPWTLRQARGSTRSRGRESSKWLRRALDAATSRLTSRRTGVRKLEMAAQGLGRCDTPTTRARTSERVRSKWLRRALDAATCLTTSGRP